MNTVAATRHYSRIVTRRIRRHQILPIRRRFYDTSARARQARVYRAPAQTLPARKKLCLLVAAHNEELVLAKTLTSAIEAGMPPEHIYVVDDNSSDSTSAIARSIIPFQNVMRVRRSGKGLALTKAARRFDLTKRYSWIHIADADGAFAPNYFQIFRRELRMKNAAATGYIRSLPGRRISEYRVYEYTVGMEIHRRLQVLFNIMPVIPGPTSCFRWDVFEKVNFDNKSLTEDFDVTMQLHRQKLGRIQFIPRAVAYTQDPRTIRDYTKQITRWNRGGLQSMLRYNIGRRLSLLDVYLSYQIIQNLLFFASYLVWVPYLAISRHSGQVVAAAFVTDVGITYTITLFTALRTKRWDVLSAFPQVYALRWLSLAVFLKAFVEVVVLRKFGNASGVWSSNRYVVRADAAARKAA